MDEKLRDQTKHIIELVEVYFVENAKTLAVVLREIMIRQHMILWALAILIGIEIFKAF